MSPAERRAGGRVGVGTGSRGMRLKVQRRSSRQGVIITLPHYHVRRLGDGSNEEITDQLRVFFQDWL